MNKRTFVAVVLLGLIAVSPVLAHHSLAGVYDLNKTERSTGVVQKFAFTNPHGALHIAIKDKNGDTITVTYNPALNGATIGFLRSIVLPDKKEVEFVPN